MPNRLKITAEMQARFCDRLALNGGIVTEAANWCHLDRSHLYRVKKDDPDFSDAWDEAQALGDRVMLDEARRRAMIGVDEDVYYQGGVVGKAKRYSDYLMARLLAAKFPEFKDRLTVDFSQATEQQIADELATMSDEKFNKILKRRGLTPDAK